ncbi:hypothetical protein [Actinoplanes sp. NPDC049316]|uniref:hypothetical protein n=1 Tax=Actinoplanes sp. NPDC049316 TaxID=3154727 RepID=UPI003427DCB4
MRVILAALAASALLTATVATSAAAHDPVPRTTSVRGTGLLANPVGDEIRFTVDAHAVPDDGGGPFPDRSWGTARLSHRFGQEDPPHTIWYEVAVDCLATGGGTATVTGVVVRTAPDPAAQPQLGARLGFSIDDNGPGHRDRVGLAGPTDNPARCMAPAAFFAVSEGGYKVRDADRGSAHGIF